MPARPFFRHVCAGENAAALRALVAQQARQCARVDVGDRDDAVATQIDVKALGRAPVTREARQIADHESRGLDLFRFLVDRVDASVADMRIGQRDDLARVGGIGQDFLITGDRGVEHDFADGFAFRTDRDAAEDRAVCEGENGWGHLLRRLAAFDFREQGCPQKYTQRCWRA